MIRPVVADPHESMDGLYEVVRKLHRRLDTLPRLYGWASSNAIRAATRRRMADRRLAAILAELDQLPGAAGAPTEERKDTEGGPPIGIGTAVERSIRPK